MKRQFDPDEGIAQWKRLFDALCGGGEDIDPEEAGQILASAGFEYGELRKRMYAKLAAKAASFRLEGKAVPQALAEALEVFRPEDAPPRNEAEVKKQAKRLMERLFGPEQKVIGGLRFAFSYRNRQDLSPEDVKLLDSFVEKLKAKLGEEK